jgi:hypothetical protein
MGVIGRVDYARKPDLLGVLQRSKYRGNNSIIQSRHTGNTNTAPVPVIANPQGRNSLHFRRPVNF